MALTDRELRGLPVRDKPYRISDKGGTRGLNIQIQPTGKKIWELRYTDPATEKRRYHRLGEYPDLSLADARNDARSAKDRLKSTGHPTEAPEIAAGSVKVLLTGYWEDMERKGKSSWVQVKAHLEANVPEEIMDLPARDVTEADVIKVLAVIHRRGAHTLANRVRGYLQTAWRWGRAHDNDPRLQLDGVKYRISHNPITDIPRDSSAERVITRVLNWEEVKQVWSADKDLDERDRPIIAKSMVLAARLILATGGQRPQEITGINHKTELDRESRVLILPPERVKNRTTHIIPLTDLAIEIIDEALEYVDDESDYLFPGRYKTDRPIHDESLRKAYLTYCNDGRHGMEKWTPRDLRRTAKTRMGEIGISKEVRDRIQNHALQDVSSMHYDFWDYVPERREALEKWCKHLAGLI